MNPTDPAAYEWPEPTRATLLAGLAATRDADERARWARLLPGKVDAKTIGLCVHDHCPLDDPHWHGGVWRSGHMRSVTDGAS